MSHSISETAISGDAPAFENELFKPQDEQTIRVHTLGRFTVQIDRQPIPQKRAAQQKPLELLQVLISLGGRNVSSDLIGSSLWPDAEGDAAANAFDINLHRVRKLLGCKDAISACAGKYSLNNERVWVDAWAFERLLNGIDAILNEPRRTEAMLNDVEQLLENALSLYHGGFLSREPVRPWNVTLRERLRFKLFRHISDVCHIAEENGRWAAAIRFYLRGLEVEPLAEELYQRLMLCYRNSERRAEALAIYQRCRANLSAGLELAPSPLTEELRASIQR